MKKIVLPILVFLFMVSSCHSPKKALVSGLDRTNLDTTVRPNDDFYQYACGGWMKNNPLTAEYSRYGSFDKLAQNNLTQLRTLIEDIASKPQKSGSVSQKIADLYSLAMDTTQLNADGYKPALYDLNKIASLRNLTELSSLLPELLLSGYSPFFNVYVDADPMNSSRYLTQTYQGGISLNERDYYIDQDEHTVDIRNKYCDHIQKMFVLFGYNATEAKLNMEAVLRIETRLARASFDQVQLRDPHANYNRFNIVDLQKLVPQINWTLYFKSLGLSHIQFVNVSQKPFLAEVGNILGSERLVDLIAYLKWTVIDRAAPYLSDQISTQNFNFYGKVLSGKEEQSPRWKRAVSAVDGSLGEAVGQMYVKKYFSSEAKLRMTDLVTNLKNTLSDRIDSLEWMSDSTKSMAQAKLSTFYVKIGYPDKWRNYSNLHIQRDSYYANICRANRFEAIYRFSKADQKVDRSEWLMTPQTVNAYYNPSTNEICFPAGILQYPFFDMNADDAFNYGAIGVVIGHEMTHGFDDQGRQYDKDGNLRDWWTSGDAVRFEQRSKVMVDFFNKIEVAPGVNANGQFTLGENIADHGGLQIAFQAFKDAQNANPLKNIDGFTPDQRFFLSYANVWAGNIRPEQILLQTKTDPHSLGKWRVNAALPHISGWYNAFDIVPADPMYVPPMQRVSIW